MLMFTLKEADAGLRYAEGRFGAKLRNIGETLDLNRMCDLANRIRARMQETKITFGDAREEVLNGADLKRDSTKRKAYRDGLGKMFSTRNQKRLKQSALAATAAMLPPPVPQ